MNEVDRQVRRGTYELTAHLSSYGSDRTRKRLTDLSLLSLLGLDLVLWPLVVPCYLEGGRLGHGCGRLVVLVLDGCGLLALLVLLLVRLFDRALQIKNESLMSFYSVRLEPGRARG